jgi:hypothetical protein
MWKVLSGNLTEVCHKVIALGLSKNVLSMLTAVRICAFRKRDLSVSVKEDAGGGTFGCVSEVKGRGIAVLEHSKFE